MARLRSSGVRVSTTTPEVISRGRGERARAGAFPDRRFASLLRSPWALLTAGFIVSRLVYALLGVRFDATPYPEFWQYLDPGAVRRDPAGSFLYFHIQPPLYNLAVAAAAKLSPFGVGATMHATFVAVGYTLAAASFAVAERLGFTRRQALVVALVVSCNPTAILFENLLFYSYPTAALMVVATLLLMRYADSRCRRDGFLFFSALAAVILIRSLYHPVWFLVAGVALLVLLVPTRRRDILAVAIVPLLIVTAVFTKNAILFGELSSSSWFGMNLARASTLQIPLDERVSLVAQRRLSVLALRPTFEYYATYADTGYGTPSVSPSGHEVLDRPVRSDGSPNFNYEGYLGIYRQYREDAFTSMRLRPAAYLRGQALAYAIYLSSPAEYSAGKAWDRNRSKISALDATWRTAAYGQIPRALTASTREGRGELANRALMAGIVTMLSLVALLVFGVRLLWTVLRRRRAVTPPVLGVLFGWATIAYVTLAGNALDVGENQRFRYDVEPLLLLLTAWLVREGWQRWKARPVMGPPEPAPRAADT